MLIHPARGRWTLTTQFGSLCFGSFVLSVVHVINQAVQAMRDGARRGDNLALKVVAEILGCICNMLEVWLRFLTKLATITLVRP